jgi:Flp pilus assembly pilin Flp
MTERWRRFAGDETGTTMIEYAIVASLVSIAAFAAFSDVGTWLANNIAPIATLL